MNESRVEAALRDLGVMDVEVRTMPDSTRTAAEAASAVGCTVGQIAKSILFRSAVSGKPVLVITSGANRVNEKAVAALRGEGLGKADADFVREATGYVIGGVAPVGFPQPIETWLDEDLLQYETVWAAAGTPFSLFAIEPARLAGVTASQVAKIL